jgi:hypothetical protein
MRPMRLLITGLVLAATVYPAWCAKVIMKDGKIYEGKIIDDSDGDVLIKTPLKTRPILLPSEEVLSVTKDPEEKPVQDPQRYASLESLLFGNVSVSKNIQLSPSPGLWVGGGLRLHPLIEIGAGIDWRPMLSGELAMSDGTTTRRYERFSSWSGGFGAKLYPFYRWYKRTEPFVFGGFEWSRLTPRGSGDALKGDGFKVGLGASYLIKPQLALESRLYYRKIDYDRVFFLQREGTISPAVQAGSIGFGIGLSYRI